jgi:GNAT superfamily N-acetyltransferase
VSIGTLAYDPARRAEVFDVLERVRGYPVDEQEFDWWFDGNPVGPRIVALAEEEGRIVGVLGASTYRAVVRGDETLATLPLWAVTDPDYRGRGIFQHLNREVERAAREAGATIELGFTNRMAGPIYIAKLGWLDVDRLRVWARPLVPFAGGRGGHPRIAGFGADQERAYREVAPRLANHFVRDAAYLNWRYAESPRGYTVVPSRNGYAVVGRKEFKGIDCAYVADLVAPTVRETRWLLRRCVRAGRGARLLLALLPSLHASAYVAAGFLPTPTTIRLIGHALEDDLPTGRGSWHFTLGDTDIF